jgi:ABC-2 type transport system ATP-binding protein
MNMLDAVIRIDGLVKTYGKETAIDQLTLDVPRGAVVGVLGETGAGKTTTIQTLLGLVRPDAGRVEVLGLDPTRQGLEVRRRVGYVPEVPVLYETMTVGEIGWFAAGFHPDQHGAIRPYQDRYQQLIDGFELPRDRKIKALSKGMRAKVSLSLAMAGDPALLILDEPTSGLDMLVRLEFLESMIELAGEGRTVFLSSHQIGEVERVASHVALLRKGKVILVEPLDTLKATTFALTLTFSSRDHPTVPPESLSLTLIDATDAPRHSRWLVRANDRASCEAARGLPGVEAMELDAPGLVEIDVGYMRSRRPEHPFGPRLATWVA